jgi:hypothetical protein
VNTPTQVFYNYVADFGAIAQGITSLYQLKTDSDSVFEIRTQQLCVASNNSDIYIDVLAGDRYGGLLCSIYDTQTGRYLTNGLTPVQNIFGTSQYPNVLPKPHFLLRRSVLEITVQNNSAYNLAVCQLVFSGIKHLVQGV